jgi:hypothetical protein
MPAKAACWVIIALLLSLTACTDAVEHFTGRAEQAADSASFKMADERMPPPAPDMEPVFAYAAPEGGLADDQPDAPAPGRAQDVIYEARLTVQVDDFVKAQDAIRVKVETAGGFVARNEQRGESADKLSGTMILKVPASQYAALLTDLRALGRVFELSENAEDVSDQLIDLDARLSNARKLEQRILTLLDEKTGHIREIIEAERELAQIRTQIEELDGNQKRLRQRVALATVTVNLFVSGSKDLEARTWYGPLLQDLRDLGFVLAASIGALVTIIVAILPWLILLWLLRRWWKRRKSPHTDPTRRNIKKSAEDE